jgi:glycine/D-amino acid oxidase-like deaminating enzyme
MRTRIIPVRGVVTAQKPPKDLGITPPGATDESWAGTRSFVFYPETSERSFHYLTQQPAPPGASSTEREGIDKLNGYPVPSGELMLGGWLTGNELTDVGVADDREWNPQTRDYLSRAIRRFFAVEEADGDQSHMKAHWGGIMGASVDSIPWVGRIPESIAGRIAPRSQMLGNNRKMGNNKLTEVRETLGSEETIVESSSKASARLAPPGEWLAAGYSGEGMVHAWMSAKAVAYMVLGLDKDHMESSDEVNHVGEWFPDVFRLTEERWKNTGLEDLIAKAVF